MWQSVCIVFFLHQAIGQENSQHHKVVRSAYDLKDLQLETFFDQHDQESYVIQFEQRDGRVLLVEKPQPADVTNMGNIASFRKLQYEPQQASTGAYVGNLNPNEVSLYGSEVTRITNSTELFESIVGNDDRVKVVDVMQYPYRTIGRVLFNCGGKIQACTGTLIGPNLVVTSAHCIYSRVHGRCSDFTFGAAQQGKWAPFGEVAVTRALTQPQWLLGFPRTYDYGILVLEREIGYLIGWLSYGYDCADFDQDLYTAGYPNDLDAASTTMYEDSCLNTFLDACPCARYGEDTCPESVQYASTFKHTCDTFLGQSGAPLWTYLEEGGFPQVRGFHAAGFTDTSFDQRNTGVYVGQQMYNFFQQASS
eukprot:TRINITY_DN1571_c0_g1_i1.p1 TRINITY_DN1571_c0_g1~~TRINITY_DN1571_c0_g1_i1.p1  ORF type:complete len:364 (-),score=17.48 TRINITY_DN1571_c0_g1_i1:476-1567(-)